MSGGVALPRASHAHPLHSSQKTIESQQQPKNGRHMTRSEQIVGNAQGEPSPGSPFGTPIDEKCHCPDNEER